MPRAMLLRPLSLDPCLSLSLDASGSLARLWCLAGASKGAFGVDGGAHIVFLEQPEHNRKWTFA